MKSNDYFTILEKKSTKVYKNPNFVTLCDDFI